MKTGELIRRYRKMRKMTQADLADACGLSDSAIRNYELGNRMPGSAQLEKIAAGLGIAPAALYDIEEESVRDALELLFRMEDSYGLHPVADSDGILLALDPMAPHAPKLFQAIEAWEKSRKSLDAGEMSQDEYALWKASFGREE